VVPEVNPGAAFAHRGIIANPNCTTILLCLALAPLEAKRRIRRVVVSTYQSASGAGARAMEELRQLTRVVLEGGSPSRGARGLAGAVWQHSHGPSGKPAIAVIKAVIKAVISRAVIQAVIQAVSACCWQWISPSWDFTVSVAARVLRR
jgi:N-acetyl-gamma-glutamylphosphate reductase